MKQKKAYCGNAVCFFYIMYLYNYIFLRHLLTNGKICNIIDMLHKLNHENRSIVFWG